MVLMLALLGGGLLFVAIFAFLRRPEETSLSYKGVELKGAAAMALVGIALIGAAVVKSSVPIASAGSINKEDPPVVARASGGATPPRRAERQTIYVPFYGALEIGGSCQGQHLLVGTWNCDASRTKRVHCQNDMVTVEPCPTACVQRDNGLNDECR